MDRGVGSTRGTAGGEGGRGPEADHLTHAWYVSNLVDREGVPFERAIRRAAVRYGVSEEIIRRHYGEYAAAERPRPPRSPKAPGTSLEGAPGRQAVWVRRSREGDPT